MGYEVLTGIYGSCARVHHDFVEAVKKKSGPALAPPGAGKNCVEKEDTIEKITREDCLSVRGRFLMSVYQCPTDTTQWRRTTG